jgi:hypothetical protein
MLTFSGKFPFYKYPIGFIKQLKSHYKYFDHPTISFNNRGKYGWFKLSGYQSELSKMRDIHKGERCFVIANGPSMKDIDVTLLEDEITIGCNGIFNSFEQWGFHTNYLITEDQEQTELRGIEFSKIKGPVKMAGLHNAHAFPLFNDITFFHLPVRKDAGYYDQPPLYPQFSKDIASIVHHGYTITHIMLQLAYHLGVKEVYIIGLDHSYGKLSQLFKPGKITVSEENYHLVQECHYDKHYYKIGDQIGVPHIDKQEMAYDLCKREYELDGRKIFNASTQSKLDIFEKVNYMDLFPSSERACK